MTIKVKQEDGTEIEAYTKDELESQRNEAVENAKKEVQSAYEAEKTQLSQKLKDAEEALEKSGDKEFNFSQLRKNVDEAKKKLEDSEKSWSDRVNGLEAKLNEKEIREVIRSKSGDDEELAKKIRFHYDNSLKTVTDLKERIEAATVLAGVTKDNKINPSVISSSGAGGGKVKSGTLTQEQSSLAKKLGISDEDVKKYNK